MAETKRVFITSTALDLPLHRDNQAAFQDWIASVDDALPPANRIKCQPVAEKVFGLRIDGSVQAFRVSGRESIIHWSEVRFE